MKGRLRVPLFVVALALLGLIGLLATLQYRWLGLISEAERQRMRASLETGAAAFAQDFDAELTRAFLLFQTDPLGEADEPLTRFAARYDRWNATAKFPRLIRNFYTFAPGEHPHLEKFDPAARAFVATEWPASMRDWPAHLSDTTSEQTTGGRGNGTIFIRRMASPVWEAVPAIVVPTPLLDGHGDDRLRVAPRLGYTILEIDQDYVSHDVLPALAEQHFTRVSGADFQVAVVSRANGGRMLFHSNDSFVPAPDSRADATADLFSVRTQDFSRVASEVHRFTAFAATLRVREAGRAGRSVTTTGRPPLAIVLERDRSAGQPGPRSGETLTSTASVTRVAATPPSWQLLVTHQSGSLAGAVATVRRRNLVVSSSILGVLAASVGLLILTTRQAQRLAQQQTEFVATVSHELRTPLAVIRSAAENLADGIVEDSAQVRKYGELVKSEGRRLTDLVEQILEFSGIQSGERRLNAVPVPVGPLVRDVMDGAAALVAAAGMRVEVNLEEGLPPVLGDEPALGRVLQNLLANAIKYGAAGGWIGVDARRQGHDVLITVADRGIGIHPSDQPRIFEPFYRAPAVVEARIQGAGLGLSLVQRIVLAHGGKVSVRSTPGEGAAFTVQLPVASSEGARRSDVPRTAIQSAGPGVNAPRYS